MLVRVLDPNWDTKILVQEEDAERGTIKEEVEMRVLAEALRLSPYLKGFLAHMHDKTGLRGTHIHKEDTGITVKAVEIVLRALHHNFHVKSCAKTETRPEQSNASMKEDHVKETNDSTEGDKAFPDELLKVDAYDIWAVIALVNVNVSDFTEVPQRKDNRTVPSKDWTKSIEFRGKFLVDSHIVRAWFLEWRTRMLRTLDTQAKNEQMLFPFWAFQDEAGWRYTTQWLCRNTSTGQIAEFSPFIRGEKARASRDYYQHLHLPKYVIAAVRRMRNQLRTEVSNQIWDIVRGDNGFLSGAGCFCRVVATYNYVSSLEKVGILEPELSRKKTVWQVMQLLRRVEYSEPAAACIRCCSKTIQANLKAAQRIGDFDGMNLLCAEEKDSRRARLFGPHRNL